MEVEGPGHYKTTLIYFCRNITLEVALRDDLTTNCQSFAMGFPFDEELFRESVSLNRIVWRRHILEKMIERGIERSWVIEALRTGEVIREYIEDKPFPSILLLSFMKDSTPLHVVASFDENGLYIYVITAYIPDLSIFLPDFKTKRT